MFGSDGELEADFKIRQMLLGSERFHCGGLRGNEEGSRRSHVLWLLDVSLRQALSTVVRWCSTAVVEFCWREVQPI